MPKDRHSGRRIQVWLKDDELSKFDRLLNRATDREKFLKLMEHAEKSMDLEQKLKDAHSQIDKLCKDLKQQQPKEIIKEVPKYIDRIVEKPIEKIVEKIVEKVIEKPIEKTVYVGDDDCLPEYFPFENQEEYKKWLREF